MSLRELRLSTRITVSALIIVTAGAGTLAFIENARIRDTYLSELRTDLKNDLETEKLRLNQAINTLGQDVLFLSETPPVSGIVRAALNRGYDPLYGNTHKVWAERLQMIFTAFTQAHPNYFQIRYIGLADDGREIVRIRNHEGRIDETPRGELQRKSDREYFQATLRLHKGQIHLSEFDFAEEWDVPEHLRRRTLRASTPVFTPSGRLFGIVVINLDVSGLLTSPSRSLPPGTQTYIADMAGEYLLHPNPQEAFVPRTGASDRINADFPFVETMFTPQAPDYLPLQAVTTRAGSALACAMRIHFDPSNPSRFLLMLHSIPGAVAATQIDTIPARNIVGGFIAMLLVGGIAMLVLRRTFYPLEKIAFAADEIAGGNHDVHLPNISGGEIGSLTRALNSMLAQLSQREKSLLESEAKYRRLHESMMDAFFMVDMSGRLIEFNHAFREMLGYSPEELQRMNYIDLVPPKWRGLEKRITREHVVLYGHSPVYELEYTRRNGIIFPVEIKAFLLRNKDDQPEAIWAIVRDITERRRAETELQRFFNLIPELACIASTDGHFLKVNPAWQATLGYTEQELISTPFLDFIHPDDREATMNEVARQIQGQTTIQFINRYCRKDGSYRWLEWKTTPSMEGRLLYATARDITERKQTDEQLRKSAEEIADLYNHAPCGYHSLDKDGNILLINDTELSWLGYTRDEVIGKIKWMDLLAPTSLLGFKKAHMQFIQQGSIHDIEVEIIRKDGTTFAGLVNASAIYDRSGNYVMSRSTVVDITERKRVKRQLQELSAHLQTIREEEKANIAREIHDDLGGTLTALKIEAYRLESDLTAKKAATPLIKRVISMSQLLDSAVGVTRRIITDLRPTILDDLGLLAALEWQAAQFQKLTGIRCRVNCVEDKSCLTKQYSIALFRIFQETLTNVARHSGASRVEVEYHCDGEEVTLSICDNGRGVPAGHVVASTSFGQRGMTERVEQLGGKISFNSPPEGGFSVIVVLPLQAESEKGERI